jgi:AP-3 complex subunit beta
MLLRYARTQFVDPNKDCDDWEKEVTNFYDDDEEEEEDEEGSDENTEPEKKNRKRNIPMDPDHRILLKSAKPLLQSRNAAVVMATAQLYYHCAPRAEVR